MESKTDLRIVKTKKILKETFLDMRRNTPLEKIQVRELCKKALINKSTFYSHYGDVFELSNEIEDDTLELCFEQFPDKELLFQDPKSFFMTIGNALDSQEEVLQILGRDRTEIILSKVEKKILSLYKDTTNNVENEFLISFIIGGTMHIMQLFSSNRSYDNDTLTDNVARLIQKLVQ